jgi:hypothetical protein
VIRESVSHVVLVEHTPKMQSCQDISGKSAQKKWCRIPGFGADS